MTAATTSRIVNGIDTEALTGAINTIAQDASKGMTKWAVATHWKGGTRSDTQVRHYEIGGVTVPKDFTIRIDEPLALCGTNQYANPQEYLLAAMNACMVVGFSAVCALKGIELEELVIETSGDIDLRGFLGLDATVKPGYPNLRQTVTIKAKAPAADLESVHDIVKATSPNFFNITNAIATASRLVVK